MTWWEELGVPKSKLVMGAATYGRTFIMAGSSLWHVGDPSNGGGQVGSFSGTPGFLAYYEVSLQQQMMTAEERAGGRKHGLRLYLTGNTKHARHAAKVLLSWLWETHVTIAEYT